MTVGNKVQNEAKKAGRNTKHEVGKAFTGVRRAVHDFFSPPSTEEQVSRVFHDTIDEVTVHAKNLSGDAKVKLQEVSKQVDHFMQTNPTAKQAEKFFQDVGDNIKDASHSPVLQSLKKLLQNTGAMFAALAGSDQDRTKAWKHLQDSATTFKDAVKNAVLGKHTAQLKAERDKPKSKTPQKGKH